MNQCINTGLLVVLVMAATITAVAQDQDADIGVGKTDLSIEGRLNREPASKDYPGGTVIVECDKDNGECLLAQAWIQDGKPRVGLSHFSVVRWTENEVLAEPAGVGHMCYNDVLLIKLAKPFKGPFPGLSKGATTLTRTPKALATEQAQKACESFFAMKPAVYRLVK